MAESRFARYAEIDDYTIEKWPSGKTILTRNSESVDAVVCKTERPA